MAKSSQSPTLCSVGFICTASRWSLKFVSSSHLGAAQSTSLRPVATAKALATLERRAWQSWGKATASCDSGQSLEIHRAGGRAIDRSFTKVPWASRALMLSIKAVSKAHTCTVELAQTIDAVPNHFLDTSCEPPMLHSFRQSAYGRID